MTYSEFLNYISNGFTLFYNTLISVSNTLLSNYFFITMLGLVIFVSIFYFVLYDIFGIPFFSIKKKNKYNLDNVRGGK